jgi:hypothetical protein
MSGACSMHGGGEIRTELWSENRKGNDSVGNLGVKGWIILKQIL